jgi:light-regulated signal transduction histidine kinase (bacteriophytochrome)
MMQQADLKATNLERARQASAIREATGDALISNWVTACETRAYHRSSSIQAHGLLLVVDPASMIIVRASANAGQIFGLDFSLLLGSRLMGLLDAASYDRITGLINASQDAAPARASLLLQVVGPRRFEAAALVYWAGKLICIEIEPPRPTGAANTIAVTSPGFLAMVDRIAQADMPSSQLPAATCDVLRQVTGFERVWFCRFDCHGHGHVQGESNAGVLPSLMDHHFPATDIPAAARKIFVVNPFRLIADIAAPGNPVIGGDGSPLDLTHSASRAIADTHLRYLRSMGVVASASWSVVTDGHLDAMFGAHHTTARWLSFDQMALCRHLVELFRTRFDFLKIREEGSLLKQRTRALYDLATRFRLADCDLASFIVANHDDFCALLDADDIVCRFGEHSHIGRSLNAADADQLLTFLAQGFSTGMPSVQTDSLGYLDARFQRFCPAVAGVLAFPLDMSGGNVIAWLRRETIVVKTWSGDPHNAVTIDDQGMVGPRTSFLSYLRQTKGTSLEWPATAADVAQQMQHIFSQMLASHYEIRMRKAAEQANALKTEFIANISHELRSPMHAIIGFGDLLSNAKDNLPSEKRQRFATTITDNGRRLLRLIEDLLDLSQLEAGKMTFDFTTTDLAVTIERAIAGIESLVRAKAVEIQVRDLRQQSQTFFDANRMEQVIINLLSNAVKFSPPQSRIVITLQTTDPAPGPSSLVIQVSDQGVGIPERELEAIFDKFIQSSRTKSGAGGTGLGLGICREIVQAHHGRIWAANNPGGGASLFVQIPQIAADHEKVTP